MQVDFNAVNEYDMINNYKVLQDCLNKLKVDKVRCCALPPSLVASASLTCAC